MCNKKYLEIKIQKINLTLVHLLTVVPVNVATKKTYIEFINKSVKKLRN